VVIWLFLTGLFLQTSNGPKKVYTPEEIQERQLKQRLKTESNRIKREADVERV
jgi:hypothetical protein